MTTAYENVLRNPRSISARKELVAEWKRAGDPRAKLLDFEVRACLAEASDPDSDLGNAAARLIYKQGDVLAGPIARLVKDFDFERGLVARIAITAADVQADARSYFDAAPLLGISLGDPEGFLDVLSNEALAQILDLGFYGRGVDDDLARAIATSAQLRELRVLNLSDGTITHAGLGALTESKNLPNLISLEVTGNPCQTEVNEVDGHYYWIGPAGLPYWEKAFADQLHGSAGWVTSSLVWPPVFDTYAWVD